MSVFTVAFVGSPLHFDAICGVISVREKGNTGQEEALRWGKVMCNANAMNLTAISRWVIDPLTEITVPWQQRTLLTSKSSISLEPSFLLVAECSPNGKCTAHRLDLWFLRCFRHGDLNSAFTMIDRMVRDGFVPDSATYAHLLQACISDKQTGFKLAIEVCCWNKAMDQ